MKTFEITKEQILLLADQHSWSEKKLKEWFPQAFETGGILNKWNYVDCGKYQFLFFPISDDNTFFSGYGISIYDNEFDNDMLLYKNQYIWRLATEEEVKTALIAEAKKRGFKDGVKFINILGCLKNKITAKGNEFLFTDNELWFNHTGCVFKDGVWAEIISEPIELTLEQIAEKFNVNVEQIKIKK